MNLKKFKKSLVSIVLGSSLFLGNGGVICQQSKARFPDEFINSQFEKYKDNSEMIRIIKVLKFFSGLHHEPKHADDLSFIHTSSLSLFTRLIPLIDSEEPTEFCKVLFANAMMAATATELYIKITLAEPGGTTSKDLTNEMLFERLNSCSEYNIVITILKEELKLIFSDQQINDPQVEKPEGYSRLDNAKLYIRLKNLLTSAIELLSE